MSKKEKEDFDKYLTTSEVASLFRVDPKTVTRWAKSGRLDTVRTMGGHRRFRRDQVESALDLNNPTTSDDE